MADFSFDRSLLRYEDAEVRPSQGPYKPHDPSIHVFSDGKRTLGYVTANHEKGLESQTFQVIAQAFENNPPEFVIIESIESGRGISPEFMVREGKLQAVDGFKKVGEPVYTAYLAAKKNIPFSGGEPSEEELFKGMRELGYSDKEMMAYRWQEAIMDGVKNGELNEANFDKKTREYFQSARFSFLPPDERMTPEEFKGWFAQHDATGKTALEIKSEDMAPKRGGAASYLQTMSADSGDIREHHLAGVVEHALQDHKNVLVVYGWGHFEKARPMYEQALPNHEETIPKARSAVDAGISHDVDYNDLGHFSAQLGASRNRGGARGRGA